MKTKFIEATNQVADTKYGNWGKFAVCQFDSEEWARKINAPDTPKMSLLNRVGWGEEHLLVLDLQTGEGAIFRIGGDADYDLNSKHKIWVCPLFQPFLNWLYLQDVSDLDKLPQYVNLADAEFSFGGYRREGKDV